MLHKLDTEHLNRLALAEALASMRAGFRHAQPPPLHLAEEIPSRGMVAVAASVLLQSALAEELVEFVPEHDDAPTEPARGDLAAAHALVRG